LWSLITFLLGASAIRAGSRGDIEYELMMDFLAKPEPPVRDPLTWLTQSGRYRPPGNWLPEAGGDGREGRELMLELVRDGLDVLAGIVPLDDRRTALITLYDDVAADAEVWERALSVPSGELESLWAAQASDSVLAALPELHGPIGYLKWAVDGLVAVHDRLMSELEDGDPVEKALARLLL